MKKYKVTWLKEGSFERLSPWLKLKGGLKLLDLAFELIRDLPSYASDNEAFAAGLVPGDPYWAAQGHDAVSENVLTRIDPNYTP